MTSPGKEVQGGSLRAETTELPPDITAARLPCPQCLWAQAPANHLWVLLRAQPGSQLQRAVLGLCANLANQGPVLCHVLNAASWGGIPQRLLCKLVPSPSTSGMDPHINPCPHSGTGSATDTHPCGGNGQGLAAGQEED